MTSLLVVSVERFEAEPFNPFLYTDYASCNYLKMLENDRDFRRKVPTTGRRVTPDIRSTLVNLLVHTHNILHFQQESLYLSIAIIDHYLQYEDASSEDLTVICLSALHLASRFDESTKPLSKFAYILCGKNDLGELLLKNMEDRMIIILKFRQCPPLTVHFLYHFIRVRGCSDSIRAMAEFFLELSFHNPELSSMLPSLLAASVLVLSLRLSNSVSWSSSLTSYTGYSKTDLHEVIVKLAKNALKARRWTVNRAVIKKYSVQSLFLVSRRVYEVRQKKIGLEQIADGE